MQLNDSLTPNDSVGVHKPYFCIPQSNSTQLLSIPSNVTSVLSLLLFLDFFAQNNDDIPMKMCGFTLEIICICRIKRTHFRVCVPSALYHSSSNNSLKTKSVMLFMLPLPVSHRRQSHNSYHRHLLQSAALLFISHWMWPKCQWITFYVFWRSSWRILLTPCMNSLFSCAFFFSEVIILWFRFANHWMPTIIESTSTSSNVSTFVYFHFFSCLILSQFLILCDKQVCQI